MEHHPSDLRMSMENRGFEPRLPLYQGETTTDYSKRAFDRIRGSLGSITWDSGVITNYTSSPLEGLFLLQEGLFANRS